MSQLGTISSHPLPVSLGISLAFHLVALVLFANRSTVIEVDPGVPQVFSVQLLNSLTAPQSADSNIASPEQPNRFPAESNPRPLVAPKPSPPKSVLQPAPRPLKTQEPAAASAEQAIGPTDLSSIADAASAQSAPDAVQTMTPSPVNAQPSHALAGTQADLEALYVAEVRAAILAEKRYPSLARRRSIGGIVIIRLEIEADGALTSTRILELPHRILGKATTEAIRRASPFAAPPGGPKSIEIAVHYQLIGS